MSQIDGREIVVDYAHQATKYPVYKDVSGLWRYDYASAEKRRFRAKEIWNPNRLPYQIVDVYLESLSISWGPSTGLTQEIALKYLVNHGYSIEGALGEQLVNKAPLKALIREETRIAERTETVAFIGSLLD